MKNFNPAKRVAYGSPAIFIALASLIAVLPLLVKGNSCGHDFSFHLQNWMEVASQWHHGILLPRWDFAAAWNAGEPRMLFYPPLSWTLGALLGTFLPWSATPIVFIWIALTLSGINLFRLARIWCSPVVATVAACIYLSNPYMLFTAYERSAFAELLAAAWMPLLLAAMLRTRISIPKLALAVALLWLTNAPAAVIGCYAITILGLLRIAQMLHARSPLQALAKDAGRIASGTILGIASAAFYILPAAWERRIVQIDMATLPGMHPWENFLFGRNIDPDRVIVLHAASITAIVLFTLAIVSGFIAWKRLATARAPHPPTLSTRPAIIALSILTLIVFILLLPISAAIWKHAPELKFLQFSWRFLAIEGAAASLLFALALQTFAPFHQPTRRRNLFTIAATLTLVIAAVTFGSTHYAQECDEDHSIFTTGQNVVGSPVTEPTDEYTPTEADNDALHQNNPDYWLASTANAQPTSAPQTEITTSGIIEVSAGRPDRMQFYISNPRSQILILNLRAFPGWHVHLNNIEVATASTRDDGLLTLQLPSDGNTVVDVQYHLTADQWIGWIITLIACAILLVVARNPKATRAV